MNIELADKIISGATYIRILANSFFTVVQVKKASKSHKVTSKTTQVPFLKKLATFWVV